MALAGARAKAKKEGAGEAGEGIVGEVDEFDTLVSNTKIKKEPVVKKEKVVVVKETKPPKAPKAEPKAKKSSDGLKQGKLSFKPKVNGLRIYHRLFEIIFGIVFPVEEG